MRPGANIRKETRTRQRRFSEEEMHTVDFKKLLETRKRNSNHTLRAPLVLHGNKYNGRENTDV